ncbi:glycosylphosphatidylinositol anchor attachment 1 protein-like [Uloborus diversus]|uniref:glycosylphosphatidylinositol anchor attachment 1 protein-like n=1 Tax=Uloborus diversus TaxID=327109 RepID=UPI00240A734E|nr:glycosylphosphatidylinositol anchor attachment 1 protein-like [Uloborus diversus]
MGILSNPKSTEKLSTLLTLHSQKIIVLSFIAGIIWFSLLASDVFNNKTYFSENALLPGVVVREFNPGSFLKRLLESLREESSSRPSALPSAWIQGQFRQIGLDVYEHNFSVQYPFGAKSIFNGKNIYAILRAPKAASTEAIIISTPYRDLSSVHDNSLPSIALMIALAQTFRRHAYWSKDIIFLITEHEMIGFQAWLDAYHGISTSDFIINEKLKGTSGLIQGAINLEISSDRFSHIDVKIEGLHGQLPNLDLVNLAVELCTREQVVTSFHERFNFYPPNTLTWESWENNFSTMLHMILMQATGLPNGGHGLFLRYGIQAVSLKSIESKRTDQGSVTLIQMGRVLEGIIRSLNNLLEKFHQSFFFYLLPSTRNYISIGVYMPPFALIAIPVLIKALYLYISLQSSDPKLEFQNLVSNINYWSAYDIILHVFFGTFLYCVPMYLDYIKDLIHFGTEDLIYATHAAVICMWLMISTFTSRSQISESDFSYRMHLLLLALGGFLFTLALVNISLALILTILYVPISISLQYRGKFSFLQYFYLLLINPFVFTFLIVLIQSYMLDSDIPVMNHLSRSMKGHKKIILFAIEDSYFFGNWYYKIVTVVILPIWFSLWHLKSSKVKC